MLFINYKLFAVARKSRRNTGISAEIKKTFSWKNISCCLLAIACLWCYTFQCSYTLA
jgi:hypothetical protein